jgi:hypothetical protein
MQLAERQRGRLQLLWINSLRGLSAFFGGFLVYLAVGGAISFAFTPSCRKLSCLPFETTFDLFKATHDWSALLWLAIIFPRYLLTFPALMIALMIEESQGKLYMLGPLPFLILSIPLFLSVWAGAIYWRRRNPAIAIIAVGLVAVEVIVPALWR